MPEIIFYILPTNSEQQRLTFICKLVEKIYRNGRKVYIQTESERQSRKLDDLLWTFRAGSFVPHQLLCDTTPDVETPILISTLQAPENWQQNLINLSQHPPTNISVCDRLVEILDNSEDLKSAGRARYRKYQHQGFNITTHKI